MASLARRLLTETHMALFRASRGRLLASIGDLPVLLLTTTGRRSGAARTAPLTYIEVDGGYALAASDGGAARHPDWYLNLVAQPEVVVRVGRSARPMRAEVLSEPERGRVFALFKAALKQYAVYETRTRRTIPVVLLRPPPAAKDAFAPE